MNQSIRILHLEDDAADAELVEAILESAGMVCRITCVQTGDAFGEALRQSEYDIILADFRLPTYDGMSALRLARQLARDVPFIFVSGIMGEDAAIEGLTEGATDYVLKDKLTRLESAVKRALRDADNRQERRRAQAEVAHLSHQMELILNSAGEGIFGTDVEGNVTFVNPAMARMVGWEVNELLGQPAHDLWHHTRPDGRPYSSEQCPMQLAFHSGRTYHADDELFWRNDGTSFPAEYTSTPIREGDRVLGTVVVIKDITERKQAEEALRRSERRKTILNQIANIFLTLPDDEMYAEVLAVVLQAIKSEFGLFGFIAENGALVIPSLSRSIWSECQVSDKSTIFPPDTWGESLWGKAIRGKKAFCSDGPFRTPQGHILINSFLTVPIVFGNETIGLISLANSEQSYTDEDKDLLDNIAKNISPILNARLQRDRQEKERKQAEGEKQKLEGQLHQAQKLEAIGTLAGGIAHDFNNILAAILGYSEMALDDIPENSAARHDVKQILKASYRAKDLVQQILAFSRRGDSQERKPIQLHPIVKEALKMLRATLPTTIELHQEIAGDAGVVIADPSQIHQILVNLCTNAAHAMRDHGGVLKVVLAKVDLDADGVAQVPGLKPGGHVRLSVRDTGEGMDQATLERIFDPYFTTKPMGEGSGLGLAVVHGIVQRHEGAITVTSERGEGTAFHVFLPKVETTQENRSDSIQEPLPGGSERILYVDDEEALVALGERMFLQLGYQVTTKTSSREALALFRAQPNAFDLIITDFTMPEITGVDLAREVLKIRPDIPIVLCTGYSDKITEKQAREFGIREFYMKPLKRRSIAEVIRRVLDQRH